MENKDLKKLDVIKAVHFGKDEAGNMVINPTTYIWKLNRKLVNEVEKGDIVLALRKNKLGEKKGVPVLVVDIIKDYDNTEQLKIRSVVKIINKVKK